MNIRGISDVFKDTAADITALKSYNFGWASDRVRQGNAEDFQELNAFPRVFFSVPTITASDQTRKQDTYQVTLFFDDLLGYDNDGDADLTLQIDKWAALQQYATAFIQRLNLIKQTILPNYLFIPEPPQFTFDSFVGIQRLVTVQVNFNLVVPTNCEVTVQRIISVVGNVIAQGVATGNIFLSTSVSALIECTATATGAIVSGQQNVIEVESNITAFALASGDIVTVKTVAASVVSTAKVNAEVQRAVNVIGQLNATGQVSGNISLTLFAIGSADARATVDANLQVTTQGVVSCEGNVTGTGVINGSLFVIRTLEAQSIGQATSQSEIILSKLLSASVAGSGVSEGNIQLSLNVDASVEAIATTEANIQKSILFESSIDTAVTTSADAQITRIISADASATANSSAEAGIGVTFVAAAVSTASIVSADLFRSATMEASQTAQVTVTDATVTMVDNLNASIISTANVTAATITTVDNVAASVSGAATVTNATLNVIDGDVAAFFARVTTAGGTLNSTEQSAISTLVSNLKANGLWTKMKAIYPMVGGAGANPAAACAQNLKSSSFTATFHGGWTFASTGVKPNGSNGYMSTGANASQFTANSQHFSNYSRQLTLTTKVELGFVSYDAANFSYVMIQLGSVGIYTAIQGNDTLLNSGYTDPSYGLTISNRRNSSFVQRYNRNNKLEGSSTSAALGTLAVTMSAIQTPTPLYYGTCEIAFGSMGDGLTDTDATNLTNIVNTFQMTLSRNV